MKFFALVAFLCLSLTAGGFENCRVKYDVLYTIASVESHPKRAVGYPFIISFNNKAEMQKIQEAGVLRGLMYEKLDNRSLDCKDLKTCSTLLQTLLSHKITNLDLGAFQLNYRFVRLQQEEYFLIESSMREACRILMELNQRYGDWNMEILAKYHSYRPKYNKKYQKLLLQHYEAIHANH